METLRASLLAQGRQREQGEAIMELEVVNHLQIPGGEA